MTSFIDLISAYAVAARANLSGPGQTEAALEAPISKLIREFAASHSIDAVAHNEVTVAVGKDGNELVRPDFGVRINKVINGHIELKSPGTPLDPEQYAKKSHNYKQWQRLKELPNLLHTNGTEFRLWRYGELIAEPATLAIKDIRTFPGTQIGVSPNLESLLLNFLTWDPAEITSIATLVDTLGPLTRHLRDEVLEVLAEERRAVRAGALKSLQPISSLHGEWKRVLSPHANESEFADAFAQTVVFALVLAISEGLDLNEQPLSELAALLGSQFGVMGQSLTLVAPTIRNTPIATAVETVSRVLGAVKWAKVSNGRSDIYLHLYEHFLSAYDPNLREKSGSYYTPIELVDSMVSLTDEALRCYLDRPLGLGDPTVQIMDPAMGTGTFPLSILNFIADKAINEYGPAAASEAVEMILPRLYGIELQSSPFSVAELRLSQLVKQYCPSLPSNSLKLYIGDTLEEADATEPDGLSYTASLLAQQRLEANRIKSEERIQVIIGNPPYKDKSMGRGGWIENGIDPKTGRSPMDAFKIPGNGGKEFHLKNMYAFFWRWSTWKVFESVTPGLGSTGMSGMISFVTSGAYLTSESFRGMREYIRRQCSQGWIINLTPEGHQPPAGTGVFDINIPVAVAFYIKRTDNDSTVPADIKYREITGSKKEKFEKLKEISFGDSAWNRVDSNWQSPFTPAGMEGWVSYPTLRDLRPLYAPGWETGRTWVISPSADTLQYRLNTLVAEPDRDKKAELFHETRDSNLEKVRQPLPSIQGLDGEPDTCQDVLRPFEQEVAIPDAKMVRVCNTSFDRQFCIADSRFFHNPSVQLWRSRGQQQVFSIEMNAVHPKEGPGIFSTDLLPNKNAFRGSSGGRVYPILDTRGNPNLPSLLVETLSKILGREITSTQIDSYIVGVAGLPYYVDNFWEDLKTPGLRIPITADPEIFSELSAIGEKVIYCHSYGKRGSWERAGSITSSETGVNLPQYVSSMGSLLPLEKPNFDPDAGVLTFGTGRWEGVSQGVRDYKIGGSNVIDRWAKHRLAKVTGKANSPLDQIRPERWEAAWSIEFTELLSTLTLLESLEVEHEFLLTRLVSGPTISRNHLEELGVRWPNQYQSEQPTTE